jgi:hypothetical protein
VNKSGVVNIVQSASELPTGDGRASGTKGVYIDASDKVYLVADALGAANFKGVFLHEVGVHYGLPKLLGADKFAQVLRRVKALRASGNARPCAPSLRGRA